MIAATKSSPAPAPAVKNKTRGKITWEEFQQEFLTREDNYKYEWVRGKVLKTKRSMNQYQYFILKNLEHFFLKLKQEGKVTGELMVEIDTFFFQNTHRRPDMAWFTEEQAARMAHRQNQVPKFVIEIVSDNDTADKLLDKISDYFDSEVEVVWLIAPGLEQVHVYTRTTQAICKGDMLCSAAPALPAFQMNVQDIFKKPALEGD